MQPQPEVRKWLIAVAAPAEADAVLAAFGLPTGRSEVWRPVALTAACDLVRTGIGKVNAAACVARLLPGPYGAVVSAGIAGSLPGSGLTLGTCVLGTASIYADEGLVTPEGFRDCASMGFPLGSFEGNAVPAHADVLSRLRPYAEVLGPIATVSTCSGTDGAAAEVVARTRALAEAMEGAAVAQVAWALGVPAGEIRAISNTTGDRAAQRWDARGALARLGVVLGQALGAP